MISELDALIPEYVNEFERKHFCFGGDGGDGGGGDGGSAGDAAGASDSAGDPDGDADSADADAGTDSGAGDGSGTGVGQGGFGGITGSGFGQTTLGEENEAGLNFGEAVGAFTQNTANKAINNPFSTIANIVVSAFPGVGLINTFSGLLGGPTLGGMFGGLLGEEGLEAPATVAGLGKEGETSGLAEALSSPPEATVDTASTLTGKQTGLGFSTDPLSGSSLLGDRSVPGITPSPEEQNALAQALGFTVSQPGFTRAGQGIVRI